MDIKMFENWKESFLFQNFKFPSLESNETTHSGTAAEYNNYQVFHERMLDMRW